MIEKETGMDVRERMGEEIATLAARIDAATYELLVLIRKSGRTGRLPARRGQMRWRSSPRARSRAVSIPARVAIVTRSSFM